MAPPPPRSGAAAAASALVLLLLAASPPSLRAQMDADPPKSALPPSASSTPRTSDPIRFVSPLRSYTVFDAEPPPSAGGSAPPSAAAVVSPRRRFLPRFRAGLVAERAARDSIAAELRASLLEEDEEDDDRGGGGREWAEMEAAREEIRRAAEEARVERAHDRAVARFDRRRESGAAAGAASAAAAPKKRKEEEEAGGGSEYQFVGVVNPKGRAEKGRVTWYARRKPSDAKWSVRLVHVDRDAVVRDMFTRGMADVYGEYVNTGRTVVERGGRKEGDEERKTRVPVLEGRYSVRERSWRNLWNFSPPRLFYDSSGMYWRERRLSPGLYTDGRAVYEASYDYRAGRNGMRPVSSLDAYLKSGGVRREKKEEVLRRLREDGPDVVVEE